MRPFPVLIRWSAASIVAAAVGSSPLLAQTAGGGAAAGGGGGLGASAPAAGSGSLGSPVSAPPQGAISGNSPQTAQPFGQPNAPQTLQGPGAAASATQGTIGAPGVVGGFFGVAQPLVTRTGPAPVALQPGPRPSGVNMPLTGENARQDAGSLGVAGAAARRSFNAQAAESLNARTAQPTFPGQQSAAAVQPGTVEGWRFRWHDDLWWYYTPERSWAVWQGNHWAPYQRGALYARGGPALAGQPAAPSAASVTGGYRPDYLGVGMYSQAVAEPAPSGHGR